MRYIPVEGRVRRRAKRNGTLCDHFPVPAHVVSLASLVSTMWGVGLDTDTGIFSLPSCDWRLIRVYSLSPHAIGACYGYILSPLVRLAPATGIFSLPSCDWRLLRVCNSPANSSRTSNVRVEPPSRPPLDPL
eukprot:4981495-Pyramimonas_sp.AAC.1